MESFENTIDKLIELAPENITVHTLSIKRAARLNHSGDREVLKNPADKMVEYATKDFLKAAICLIISTDRRICLKILKI